MPRSHRALTLGFVAAMLLLATARAAPSVYPTGVTRYDPAKAYNIFVLFSGAPPGDDKTYLIDMDGNEVHRWGHRGFRVACSTRRWSAAPADTSWSSWPI